MSELRLTRLDSTDTIIAGDVLMNTLGIDYQGRLAGAFINPIYRRVEQAQNDPKPTPQMCDMLTDLSARVARLESEQAPEPELPPDNRNDARQWGVKKLPTGYAFIDSLTAQAIIDAIDGGEDPGDMPQELWDTMRANMEPPNKFFRAVVSATKKDIKKRLGL